MIQLTESAAGKVKELLVEEGRSDIALRVAVQPGGCSGLRYAMFLDDQISDKDATEEQFGVKLVIDKMSVPYLTQATIDFVDSLEQSGFTIDNPAAQSSCACIASPTPGSNCAGASTSISPHLIDQIQSYFATSALPHDYRNRFSMSIIRPLCVIAYQR